MKDVFASIGAIILAFAFFAFISLFGYWSYSYFAPRYEQVRYNTFKESQSYNDAMLRDLQNIRMEYIKANDEQKTALRTIAIHRFEVYDINRLPDDLRQFYYSIGG